VNSGQLTYNERTRCVRGPPAAELAHADRFSDLGDDTVLDQATGLVWQKGHVSSLNWVNALAHCERLVLGQHDDWRLPNAQELHSLVEHTSFNPATSFPDPLPDQGSNEGYPFWTSTTFASDPTGAWFAGFYGGDVPGSKKKTDTNLRFTRCVRGGP
jgi:hypothetical protein